MTDKDQPRKPGKPARSGAPKAASGPVVPSTPIPEVAPKPEAKPLPPVTSTLVGAGGTLPPMSAKAAEAKPATPAAKPAEVAAEAKATEPPAKPAEAPAAKPAEAKPAEAPKPAEAKAPDLPKPAPEAPSAAKPAHEPPRVTPPPPPPPARRGGFWPLFLGGVAAAALGSAATFWAIPRLPEGWRPGPVAEATEPAAAPDLQALKDEILAELPVNPAPDGDAIAEAVAAAIRDAQPQIEAAAREAAGDELTRRLAEAPAAAGTPEALAAAVQAQGERLDALDGQLAALATAAPEPGPENGSNTRAPALDAVQAELAALKTQLADLTARPEGATAQSVQALAAQVQSAESQLAALPARLDALEAGQAGLAAAARLGAALRGTGADTGAAAEALAAAGHQELADLAQNVPALADLQAGFDQAARDALAATRKTGFSLSGLLDSQTNARSVIPREGDDPDAIQSRAGAAVESGDIAAALRELEAMPEAGREAMAGWLAGAGAWVAAQEALGQITQPANSSE